MIVEHRYNLKPQEDFVVASMKIIINDREYEIRESNGGLTITATLPIASTLRLTPIASNSVRLVSTDRLGDS